MRIYVLSLLVISASNAQNQPTTNLQECIDPSTFDDSIDYFPDKFTPHNTTDLLSVSYHKSYKIVNNLYTNKSYVLYQCGTPIPSDIPKDAHHLFLPVPHQGGVAVTETPQIPGLEVLGLRSEILSIIGDPSYVGSPCVNLNMDNGVTKVVHNPDDPWNTLWVDNATQSWITSYPDALILRGPMSAGDGSRELVLAASLERTAVATFDWIGLYASLYNLESMANEIVMETEERYICSANNARELSKDIAPNEKVSILWAAHFSGIGWSVAECPTWDSAYYCEYAYHCGANLLSRPEGVGFYETYGGPAKYWYLNDIEMLELGKDANHWIYSGGDWDRIYGEKKELLDQFQSVQNNRVFDTQGQGSNAWFEQRIVEYDVTALDFCDVVGTAVRNDFYVNRWFRNVKDEPVGMLPACKPEELYAPYVAPVSTCVSLTSAEEIKEEDVTNSTESAEEIKEEDVTNSTETGGLYGAVKEDETAKVITNTTKDITEEKVMKEDGAENVEMKDGIDSSSSVVSLAIVGTTIALIAGLAEL